MSERPIRLKDTLGVYLGVCVLARQVQGLRYVARDHGDHGYVLVLHGGAEVPVPEHVSRRPGHRYPPELSADWLIDQLWPDDGHADPYRS